MLKGLHIVGNNVYVPVGIVSTLYSYSWDVYMDWGLIRSNEPGKKFLRHKILFPKWFYYYAIVSNFILRFFWLLSLIPTDIEPEWFVNV
jgi:hypothetical protein